MKDFNLKFNWAIPNIYTNEGEVLSVWANGQYLGKCKIKIEGNQIIGIFSLEKEIDDEMYVNYIISIKDSSGQMWLKGVMLLDYENGIEKESNTIKNTLLL